MKPDRLPGLSWLLLFAAISPLHAAGERDPGFHASAPGNGALNALAIQADRKVVAAGYAYYTANSTTLTRFMIARFQPETGGRDNPFGGLGSGAALIDFGQGASSAAHCVKSLPGGKLLAGGGHGNEFAMVRLDSAGQPDPGFGTGGKVVSDFNGYANAIRSMEISTDGKILVAGNAHPGTIGLRIARYESDGTLDTSFGHGGSVFDAIGTRQNEKVAMSTLPGGKILVAVAALRPQSRYDFIVSRRHPDGSRDTSFGKQGIAWTDIIDDVPGNSPSSCKLAGMAVLPDGKILVGGSTGTSFAVARFTPEGIVDPSFGRGGATVLPLGRTETSGEMLVQPDGKIVLGVTSTSLVVLTRLLPDGRPDPSFGSSGTVRSPFAHPGNAVALQDTGDILLAGGTPSHNFVFRFKGGGGVSFPGWTEASMLPGDSAEPSSVPKADGLPNLLKYAFNLDGGAVDRRILEPGTGVSGLPAFEVRDGENGKVFRVEYLERKEEGFTYTPKVSKSLDPESFAPMEGSRRVIRVDEFWDRVIVEMPLDPAEDGKLFGIVEVTSP